MRTLLRALLLLLAIVSPAAAQRDSVPPLRREMAQASFLVGRWEGTAWVRYAPDGERREARATAEGRPTLMGLALSWKSVARGADAGAVHDDDVTLRFRRDSSAFRVNVHLPGRSPADGWARVARCELSWGYEMPDAASPQWFRFTVRVDAENRLTETGERSSDGQAWWPYYGAEMAGAGPGCRPPPTPADSAARPAPIR